MFDETTYTDDDGVFSSSEYGEYGGREPTYAEFINWFEMEMMEDEKKISRRRCRGVPKEERFPWTPSITKYLCELVSIHGRQWTHISAVMKKERNHCLTDSAIRNHYQRTLDKKAGTRVVSNRTPLKKRGDHLRPGRKSPTAWTSEHTALFVNAIRNNDLMSLNGIEDFPKPNTWRNKIYRMLQLNKWDKSIHNQFLQCRHRPPSKKAKKTTKPSKM